MYIYSANMHVDNRHVPTPIYPAKHFNVPPPQHGEHMCTKQWHEILASMNYITSKSLD